MSRSEHEEVELLRRLVQRLDDIIAELAALYDLIDEIVHPPRPEATTASLSLGGTMPLDVGGTTTATLAFVDANKNPAQAPKGDGTGLVVTFATDNAAVATVGAASTSTDAAGNTTYVATVSGVSAGTYNLSATVANTSGVPLVDDDGTTPFIQPESVAGTVGAAPPAQATTAVISIA